MRITRAASKQKRRLPRKPPNIIILPYRKASVNPRFLQTFLFSFMEHPILKNSGFGVIIKAQQRSESNVLSKLTPIKTEESRGYVNAGTQQLLKPLTINVRGFLFGFFCMEGAVKSYRVIARSRQATHPRVASLAPSGQFTFWQSPAGMWGIATPLRARNDVVICGWSCCFSAAGIGAAGDS